MGVSYQVYARLSFGVVVGEMRMEDGQMAGLSPQNLVAFCVSNDSHVLNPDMD